MALPTHSWHLLVKCFGELQCPTSRLLLSAYIGRLPTPLNMRPAGLENQYVLLYFAGKMVPGEQPLSKKMSCRNKRNTSMLLRRESADIQRISLKVRQPNPSPRHQPPPRNGALQGRFKEPRPTNLPFWGCRSGSTLAARVKGLSTSERAMNQHCYDFDHQ